MNVKRTVWQRILAAVFPERCCCCDKPILCGTLVCIDCECNIDCIKEPVCRLCGRGEELCNKKGHSGFTEEIASPYYYSGAIKNAALRMKLPGNKICAELFYVSMADTVSKRYSGVDIDVIVSVPIGKGTMQSRGYNQSTVMAKGISQLLDIPFADILVKLFDTKPQRSLPAFQRSGNVSGAFGVDDNADLTDKTILLVDDVVTTGSTCNECAKMLLLAGARAVYVIAGALSMLCDSHDVDSSTDDSLAW